MFNRISQKIRHLAIALTLSVSALGATNAHAGSESVGDALHVLIPLAAYGATFHFDDSEGRTQFYKSFATNLIATKALKSGVNANRPDGSGNDSFPSTHSSVAFQGAAFIHYRYGMEYAWPAYVGAALTAYSRVDSKRHYTKDVVAGAALGIASSWYFTSKYQNPKSAVFMPYYDSEKFGFLMFKQF